MVSDEVLMLQFQAGSRESFEELFTRFRDPLHAFFRRRVAGKEIAEDLSQETWLAVVRGSVRYEPRALFRTYLYGIALKLVAGEWRRSARQKTAAADVQNLSLEAAEADHWIRDALDKLEATEREILMLREYEQLSYAEISGLLHIPMNGAFTTVSRTFGAETATGTASRGAGPREEAMIPTVIHPFSQEEMMAYLDGELPAERAAAAAQHLAECRECQQLSADLQQVAQRLAEWTIEPSVAEAPAVQAAMGVKTGAERMVFWKRPSVWMGVAAAAVLVITAISARLGRPRALMAPQQAQSVASFALPDAAAEANRPLMRSFTATDLGVVGGTGSGVPQGSVPAPPRSPSAPLIIGSGPFIIRTAEINLTSPDVERGKAEVERIARAYQGYIAQLQMNTPVDDGRTLSASLRVPAAQLDSALQELRRLGHINRESQRGEDATQRVVDVNARLANLRTTEKRLIQLLQDRSGRLADVLQVEQAVDRARGDIEVTEAEQKALSEQVALATVRVILAEEYKAPMGANESLPTTLRNAAVEGYRNVVGMFMGLLTFLLSVGPSLAIAVMVGFFPARWLWRKARGSDR